jgi:hypothetical protein
LGFIGLGLAASLFWGASDFLGGLATRKAHVVGVVAVAHGLSLGLLLLAALATHSPLPPQRFALLGLCAGTVGGVALILYYQALSLGEMGITTALTGLLTEFEELAESGDGAACQRLVGAFGRRVARIHVVLQGLVAELDDVLEVRPL